MRDHHARYMAECHRSVEVVRLDFAFDFFHQDAPVVQATNIAVERVELQFRPALADAHALKFAALVDEFAILRFLQRLLGREIADRKIGVGLSIKRFEAGVGRQPRPKPDLDIAIE